MTYRKDPEKVRAYNKQYYAARREEMKARAQVWRSKNPDRAKETTKACRAANRTGTAATKRAWKQRNADKEKAYRLKRRDAALARAREYKRENKAILTEKRRAFLKARPEGNRANASRHNAMKLNAMPLWASPAAIRAIYAEAVRKTRETGIPHEVDHIYPLRSKVMCGLHVEANLRVVPMAVNRSKSNRWWPGCDAATIAIQ